MGLFQPQGCAAWLGSSERKRSTRDVADPQGAHELQAWQPGQFVRMPLAECRVLRSLADDRVLDDRIAEMVDHGSDREHATQSIVEARLTHTRPSLVSRVPCGPAVT